MHYDFCAALSQGNRIKELEQFERRYKKVREMEIDKIIEIKTRVSWASLVDRNAYFDGLVDEYVNQQKEEGK
jgi:hypothetical protein